MGEQAIPYFGHGQGVGPEGEADAHGGSHGDKDQQHAQCAACKK